MRSFPPGGLPVFLSLWIRKQGRPPPEKLTLADLANRPDRWPPTVTLKQDMDFGAQGKGKVGQKVAVLQFDGANVGADLGNGLLFEMAANECDILEVANEAWAKLTPAQRALDMNTLMQDSSLWPDRVKCFDPFRLDSGRDVPAGKEYDLIAITNQGVTLWYREDPARLSAEIGHTD